MSHNFRPQTKNHIVNETTYTEEMNKLQDPFNPTKVHSKDCGRYTSVVLLCGFISMDQIEKRSYTLFSAGNGDWGAIYGWSCYAKDISNKLPSCKLCEQKLIKGLNYSKCKKCLNWNVERSNYSDDVIKLTNGHAKKP